MLHFKLLADKKLELVNCCPGARDGHVVDVEVNVAWVVGLLIREETGIGSGRRETDFNDGRP